ncbi:two-component sensor histidine kinase [Dyella lipolytica]|uniref:sensor histidine kinase n=1 Tax=Dyella lipolytica TaxID=1867835 RepID=UPI00235CBE77|nr:ATP-binding protein [Dyella lipolytica]GLQ48446.1 two-component sensor histidine kinase [Dyella lipolytica]
MTSLRRQLLAWLIPAYLLVAAVWMGVSYRQYETNISAFMDGQMHALANTYAHSSATVAGQPGVRALDEQHVQHDGTPIVQLWEDGGRLLATSWPIPSLGLQPSEGFHTVDADGQSWRIYTVLSSQTRVQIVQSNDFRQRVILDSARKSVEPMALLIPLSVLLVWVATLLALRPVDRLVHAIAQQDERSLEELPLSKVPRELMPLVVSINGLLKRLRNAFAVRQRFVQDAAHELRTPLTALTLQVEALHHKLGGSAVDAELVRLDAGIERMHRLVAQLLKLARQEAAQPIDGSTLVDLQQLVKESIGSLIPLAEKRAIDLGLEATERAVVRGDANDLRSVLENLLDNALRYTPAGGSVDVTLRRDGGEVAIEFADTGPGIPPELLEQVFERFYRVLGTGAQGSGLGLAIAQSAAERGGFHIELQNRHDQTGLVARVRFPQAILSLT